MNLIEIKGLTKNYGKKQVLKNLDLTLNSGKIIGLLGPNGSGKTTLIKSIMGLLDYKKGEILFEDELISYKFLGDISYLPDCYYLNKDMKIKEMISLFEACYSNFKKENALSLFTQLNIDVNSKFKTLSKGNQEKVQLILVMSRKAKLYILDEPIAGVDPAARDLILRTILNNYEETASILISTHLISDIESILDEVIFIKDGEIILNKSAEEIRAEEGKTIDELFREVFKC